MKRKIKRWWATPMAKRVLACGLALWGREEVASAQTEHATEAALPTPSNTSGATSEPSPQSSPPPPSLSTDSSASSQSAEIAELRARLAALEKASLAAQPPAPTAPTRALDPNFHLSDPIGDAATRPTTSFDLTPYSRMFPRGFLVSGYVQAQYQQSQRSRDELDSNGNPVNQDRFVVRRARIRVEQGWEYAYTTIEVDGNNNDGLAIGIRRAEATLLWRGNKVTDGLAARTDVNARAAMDRGEETHRHPVVAPPIALTIGLTEVPFGYELYEANRLRLFLERTNASRAFFAGDASFGGRLAGALGFLRYGIGAYSDNPLPDSSPKIGGYDYTAAKDIIGRIGFDVTPRKEAAFSGGFSFLGGTGFHGGTNAVKGTVTWNDANGNGVVDSGELKGAPAQAATLSSTFDRWMIGFDLQARLLTPIGRGLLYGEVYIAKNEDRGHFDSDPIAQGVNLHELGWYAAYVQEITRYGLLGLRIDAYDPNFEGIGGIRAGNLVPLDRTITTISPLVGLVLPNHARLVFEYDRILHNEIVGATSVQTDVKSDLWVIRLQGQL